MAARKPKTDLIESETVVNAPGVSQGPPPEPAPDPIVLLPDDSLRIRLLEDLVLELVGPACTLRTLSKGIDTSTRSPASLSSLAQGTLRDVLGRRLG